MNQLDQKLELPPEFKPMRISLYQMKFEEVKKDIVYNGLNCVYLTR